VTCHNPGSIDPDGGESVDLAYMAHSIHSGNLRGSPVTATSANNVTTKLPYVVYGFGGTAHDYGEVGYPQSRLFCENCHTESAGAPDGDVWLVNATASACGGCHVAGLGKTGPDAATGRYTYTYTHGGGLTVDDGDCVACHKDGGSAGTNLANHEKAARLQKTLGEQFVFEILDVTNVGEDLVPNVKFRVRKPDGTPYNVVTDPAFTLSGASLNINMAWDAGTDITNALADGTEPGLRSNSTPRRSGYAIQMNIQQLRAAAQTAGQAPDGSYTIPFFTALPVDTDDVMFQMDGHPRAVVDGVTYNARANMTVFYTGTARARLVSEAKCNDCHEQLSFHGQNRSGDPQACLVCHNASGGYADEDLGPIALGAMIHNIHAGSIPLTAEITYPQRLANCEACHLPGTYYTARDGAIAISTGSGADQFNMTDDTWDTATSGTCGGCHTSATARAHMVSNGGALGEVGGKTFAPSTATEACAVCHGPGRTADTVQAHAE
jgi:OmcA/MtrC family decaheme c-type cytochrome